jgi:hypothetical protein
MNQQQQDTLSSDSSKYILFQSIFDHKTNQSKRGKTFEFEAYHHELDEIVFDFLFENDLHHHNVRLYKPPKCEKTETEGKQNSN